MTNEELIAIANSHFCPATRNERKVDDKLLARKVAAMAEAGYKFSAATIEATRAYLQGYGVLLSGRVGVGKTLFFRLINHDALIADIGTIMGWRQAEIEEYAIGSRNCELVIDDIGCGGSKARDYGREFDALLMILNMRDPARCRFRTHFTTNLTNDELVANLDARVVDRIYGLAKCFRIETEESRREAVAFL